jgi:hypothetical protein
MSMPNMSIERRKHIEALEQGSDSLIRQLKAVPEPQKVMLFGSDAIGRRGLFTYLDLLVVMDS